MNLEFRIWHNQEKQYGVRADLSEDRMDFEFNGGYVDLGFALKHPEYYLVEQWTGLVDKHGVKIFENDILQEARFRDENFVVYYTKGSFVLKTKKNKEFHILSGNPELFELIGNHNQNPELLNDRK